MSGALPTGRRFVTVSAISAYVLPHLARRRLFVLAATLLAFAAAAFGLLSALLMAAMLEVLRQGIGAPRTTSLDWGELLNLNTAGAQVTSVLWLLLGEQSTRSALVAVGALLVGTTILAVATNVASRWLWIGIRTRVISAMQADLFDHMLSLPLSFHVHSRSGALLSRLYNDVGNAGWILPVLFHTLLRTPFLILGTLLVMLRTSVQLTALTLAAACVYIAANFAFGRLVRRSFTQQSRTRASLLALAQEALLAVRVVKAFGAEKAEVEELRGELEHLNREEIRGDLYSAQYPTALSQVLSVATAVAVLMAGLNLVAAGELTEHGMVMFVVASAALLVASSVAAQALMSVHLLAASVERLMEIWQLRPEAAEGELEARGFERELAIKELTFGYGDQTVLDRIALTVRKGEVVGIVGRTGAGKSTLVDLMLRFYEPLAGSIELDGVDIRKFSLRSYRRLFGVVPQETLLFHDTIRRNIVYGRTGLTEADVITAARAANADAFIRGMPAGYDTLVGERGIRLSGGERQRIAIARAVVARPPILIFDEATSALDNRSERLVQEAMDQVIEDHTAIVIAHRLSTLQRADRIFVLDGGRIVASGTHVELMSRDGLYRRLYDAASVEEPRLVSATHEALPID